MTSSPSPHRRTIPILLSLLATLAIAPPAAAQAAANGVAAAGGDRSCQLQDAAALERFIDVRFGEKLKELHVPGGVFVAVRDGQVILSKAYGIADIERRVPVSVDSTMFFVGSVSKPVTATALMQLVEQGKLSIDAPVNTYLDAFQLDSTFAEPVRVWHVLTHTAGFDIRHIGMGTTTREAIEPMGPHLARRMPPRVDPPGVNYSYSNYGFGLLGHLVEEVSGMPFADYTQRHIFTPLGMRHTSFDRSYDDPNRAKSYAWDAKRDEFRELAPAYFHVSPSVGLMSSGSDMARFLLAHINDGALGDARILRPETAQRMRALHYMLDPRLAGAGLGFRYQSIRGLRVIGHRGLVNDHTSILQFVPDQKAGYFVACNSQMCARMEPLIDDLLEQFFCGSAVRHPYQPGRIALAPLEGVYRPDRHARNNIEKVRGIFDEFTVETRDDTLFVRQPVAHWRTLPFVAIGPRAMQQADGGEGYLLLREDWAGTTRLYAGTRGLPLERLIRQPFWATSEFFTRFLIAAAAGLASAVVILPVAFLWRRRRDTEGSRGVGAIATWTAWSIAVMLLAFIVALRSVLASRIEAAFVFGMPETLATLLWLPHIALLPSLAMPILATLAWRRGYWPVAERIYVTAMTAGIWLMLVQLHYWNLLWFRY